MTTRTEYRAVYRRPASTLDTPADRKRGHVEEVSHYAETKEDVIKGSWTLRRPEETWARIVRWQSRTFEVPPWKDEE